MFLRALALALLLSPQALIAGDPPKSTTQWYVNGGLTFLGFEQEDDAGNRLEADRGTGLHLTGGFRLAGGFAMRLALTGATLEEGTICTPGCVAFSNDIEVKESRLVALWAPRLTDVVGLEIGGGFETIESEVPSLNVADKADGLVLEGAFLIYPGETWRVRLGMALMGLENDDDEKTGGAEFTAGLTWMLGRLELGASLRGLGLSTDQAGGGTLDTGVGELRLTVGGAFDV